MHFRGPSRSRAFLLLKPRCAPAPSPFLPRWRKNQRARGPRPVRSQTSMEAAESIPNRIESPGPQPRVHHRILDVAMPEVILDLADIAEFISQCEATRVPKH